MNTATQTALMTAAIAANSTDSKPDNKCPKCGHVWDDEHVPMTIKSKAIVTVIVLVILYFVVGLFECFNGGSMFNVIFVRSIDDYEVPKEYEILTNKKGRYVIKKGDKYLTRSDYVKLKFKENPNIYSPLKCISEKRAKSTLKHYLNKKDLNSFKPLEK